MNFCYIKQRMKWTKRMGSVLIELTGKLDKEASRHMQSHIQMILERRSKFDQSKSVIVFCSIQVDYQ